MNFSNNAISAILLCSYIGINKDDALKPLSLGEWNEFLDKLIEMKLEPSIILSNDTTELKKMSYSDDFIDRITALAARGMNRNKYIYASSYGTFVVCSDYNKGGTWSGATEAIRNEWSKVLAWDNKNYSGNQKLIEKGAVPYEITDDKILDVVTKKEVTYDQLDLFNMSNVALVCEESAEYRVNENVGKND